MASPDLEGGDGGKTRIPGNRKRPRPKSGGANAHRGLENDDEPFDDGFGDLARYFEEDGEERGDEDTTTVCSSPSCSSLSTHIEEGGDQGRAPPSPPVRTETVPRRRILCRSRSLIGLNAFARGLPQAMEARADGLPSKVSTGNTHSKAQAHDPLILFGLDLSSQPPAVQFALCACGVFAFTIVYGYLQELLAVHIAGRKFALFLGSCQFAGYAFWSFVLTKIRAYRHRSDGEGGTAPDWSLCSSIRLRGQHWTIGPSSVPLRTYVGLSLIRALDLGMTNTAMLFLNYPAKTLIKSSRVVFTMLLGLVIGGKSYRCRDYVAVSLLVTGLGIFLHADSKASVVFHPIGVMMLVVSLTCDGTLNNWSEVIMREYRVGQDEFQLQLYSIALLAMLGAAYAKGELLLGMNHFFFQPGTVAEIEAGDTPEDGVYTWTIQRKCLVLFFFSFTGLLGSSCAGAITKQFGALSMSIVGTARKAMTLFLSFIAFHNTCTLEHIAGMIIFLGALLMKSIRASKSSGSNGGAKQAVIHGSTSTMELDKLLGERSDDETSIEDEKEHVDDEEACQEMQPLVDCKESCNDQADEENNPLDDGLVDSNIIYIEALPPPEATSSLLDTATASPGLPTILSYFRRRTHHHSS